MLRELLSDLRYRLRAIFSRRESERELAEELRLHIDIEVDRLVREGLSREEARRQAVLAFGSIENVKESSRDVSGVRLVEHGSRDLFHALRLTVKQPVFTFIVVASLALGMGATTAVFNLTYSILFAPLAVPHPEQLVVLERRSPEQTGDSFSWAEYSALRKASGVGTFGAWRGASAVLLQAADQRRLINLQFVDGAFFQLIGLPPLHGRLITAADDDQRAPVAVLSYRFAQELFSQPAAAVGREVLLRGALFHVIGVMPPSYRGLDFPGWFTTAVPLGAVPLLAANGPGRDNRGVRYGAVDDRSSDARAFRIVGRLSMPPAAARSELGVAFDRCCRGATSEQIDLIGIRRGIPGGKSDFRPQASLILGLLLGGMILVLVVVCCNVASLLLVRASARQREVAVRLALGASRTRLVSQLLMESAPHAVLGGLGGLVVAAWYTTYFIRNISPDWFDTAQASDILGLHAGPAFAFAAMLTVFCGFAFAVYPALRATKQQLAQTLRLDTRASRSRRQGVVARGVVLAQVAVTVVLISAASLFAATLGNLTREDGGYATERVLLASVDARSSPYEQAGLAPVHNEILRRTRAVPGVGAVSVGTRAPIFGGSNWYVPLQIPGYAAAPNEEMFVATNLTALGYLDVAGIRLVAGRDFTESDNRGEPVVIVNRAFTRRYFGDRDPLQRSLGISLDGDTATSVRIVGVVRDAKYGHPRETPEPLIYVPLMQVPGAHYHLTLIARTAGNPLEMANAVTSAIEAAVPGVIVRRVREMESQRSEVLTIERLSARLATFVSLMALVLSIIGLYGVVAYSVARRTSEIGVRLALGARAREIFALVAKETVALVSLGIIVGVPLSFAANGALRSQLFAVSAFNPLAPAVAVLLLATAGLVASVIPATRAVRIDPRIALNAD